MRWAAHDRAARLPLHSFVETERDDERDRIHERASKLRGEIRPHAVPAIGNASMSIGFPKRMTNASAAPASIAAK